MSRIKESWAPIYNIIEHIQVVSKFEATWTRECCIVVSFLVVLKFLCLNFIIASSLHVMWLSCFSHVLIIYIYSYYKDHVHECGGKSLQIHEATRSIVKFLLFLVLLQEWGDPRKEEFYFYMKSYSPVDNVSTTNMNC